MKLTFILFAILFSAFCANAAPGDTTKVRTHNRVHMSWYGDYDRTTHFPTQGKRFNKVLMHYTLGCPDKGCSEWDYTTQVILLKKTGRLDSTQRNSPNFMVNGQARDSFAYSQTARYNYSWNASTQLLDSTLMPGITLLRFLNANVVRDTLTVWEAPYYRPIYDGVGNIIDSTEVAADEQLKRLDFIWYQYFEVKIPFELGRVITPYAANRDRNWNYRYTFDVTDYQLFLSDSVEIRAHYSGYQDGFTITLDFELIEGTPAREAYRIEPLWHGSFPYGNPNNSIENYLTPKTYRADAQTKSISVLLIQTGHGFGGNENCAEFCPKYHELKVNENVAYKTTVWRDNCGENPIYPQPGTWLYDRANWCPGLEIHPYRYDITDKISVDDSFKVDLDMEPFINIDNNSCSYIFGSALVFYKAHELKTDASIEAIINPNNDPAFARQNPNCGIPTIRVKNDGETEITSLKIAHGLLSGNKFPFMWEGSIKPGQSADITLGYLTWDGANERKYVAEIEAVNGQADDWSWNNRLTSNFDIPPVYPSTVMVWFRTNLRPADNELFIKNIYNETIWSRGGFQNTNTMHYDTISLNSGLCYYFEITDKQRNGIRFWANQDGSGLLTLRGPAGNILQNVEGDFGTYYRRYFTVDHAMNNNPIKPNGMQVYPNPSSGLLQIDMLNGAKINQVMLHNLEGKLVHEQTAVGSAQASLNLSMLSPGHYTLTVTDGQTVYKQAVILSK